VFLRWRADQDLDLSRFGRRLPVRGAASCLPQHGRLLQLLAGGIGVGTIGETGTGYGVGLAWMASAAHPDARLFSIERDRHAHSKPRR
jgi:predicted O-methyltransferase YrrM